MLNTCDSLVHVLRIYLNHVNIMIYIRKGESIISQLGWNILLFSFGKDRSTVQNLTKSLSFLNNLFRVMLHTTYEHNEYIRCC